MNNSKINGVLPRSSVLKAEMLKLIEEKENISAKQDKLLLELERLKTIKHNADIILGTDIPKTSKHYYNQER